jgi:hypothetical protein
VQRVPANRSRPILAPPTTAPTVNVTTSDALFGAAPTALGDASAPSNEQERIKSLIGDAASSYRSYAFYCRSYSTFRLFVIKIVFSNHLRALCTRVRCIVDEFDDHHHNNSAPGERPLHRKQRRAFAGPPSGAVPPPNYKCHRCGQSGHYIQQCPTNDDPQFDHRKLKHAVGIPKSALRLVEAPVYDADRGLADDAVLPTFVTPDGQLAVFRANDDAFAAAVAASPLLDGPPLYLNPSSVIITVVVIYWRALARLFH